VLIERGRCHVQLSQADLALKVSQHFLPFFSKRLTFFQFPENLINKVLGKLLLFSFYDNNAITILRVFGLGRKFTICAFRVAPFP
jgi:hypothetical protein